MLIGDVIDEVCKQFGMDRKELLGPSRRRFLMPARFALYKILNMRGLSLTHVGKVCGDRDHKTVLKGIDRAEYMMERDAKYAATIKAISEMQATVTHRWAA